jgi:hypothetical protein
MSLTDYAEAKLLAHVLAKSYWEGPGATYIGLFTNIPDDSTPGAFVVDAGLKHIEWSLTGSTATNITNIVFGPATEDWGSIQAFGLYDSIASSNQLLWGVLDEPIPVGISGTYTIAPGDITITLD